MERLVRGTDDEPASRRSHTASAAGSLGRPEVFAALQMQRTAGNRTVARLLGAGARTLARVGGWSDAAAGTANAGETSPRGTGVRRIPVEGIRGGGTVEGGTGTNEGAAGGRAIVVLPDALPAGGGEVDVLLHYHGTNTGYRASRGGGSPRDITIDRVEAQIGAINRAGGRPWVAILAQGWAQNFGAGPRGSVPTDYIDNVWRRLGEIGAWGSGAAPRRGRVALSGHSGGDAPVIGMLGGRRRDRHGHRIMGDPVRRTDFAANLDALFLFDTMYSDNDAEDVVEYLQYRLGRDLDQLRGVRRAATGDADQAMIGWIRQHGFRLRGVESGDGTRRNRSFYHSRFERVRGAIAAWLADPATVAVLGPADGPVAHAMAANLDIVFSGGGHDAVLGTRDGLLHALETLPGSAAATPTATVPAPTSTTGPPAGATPPRPAAPATPAPAVTGGQAGGPTTARPAQTAVPTQAEVTAMPHLAADPAAPPVVERVVTAATPALGSPEASEALWAAIRNQFTARNPTTLRHVPPGPLADLQRELHSTQTVAEIRALGTRRAATLEMIFNRLLPMMAPMGAGNTPPTLQDEITAEVGRIGHDVLRNVVWFDRHHAPTDEARWLLVRQGILSAFGAFEIGAAAALDRARAYYAALRPARLLGVSGPPVHHKMQERLNRANERLERLSDAEKTAIRTTLRDWGGFAIRANANNHSVLSLHSFGWAIDIDANYNPNYGQTIDALSAVQAVTGGVDPRRQFSLTGGSFADAQTAAAQLQTTSANYVAAMQDEAHLGAALLAYANRSRPAGLPALTGDGSDLIAAGAPHGRDAVLSIIAAGATDEQRRGMRGAAETIVTAVAAYRASFGRGGRRVGASAEGSAGSTAAHGFFRLPPPLVAALASSDGAGLVWLGTSSVHDWMHFELPAADRDHLLVRPDQDRLAGEAAGGDPHTNAHGAPISPAPPTPAPPPPRPAQTTPPPAPPTPAPTQTPQTPNPPAPARTQTPQTPAPAGSTSTPGAPAGGWPAPPPLGQGVALTDRQIGWIRRNPHTIRFYRRFAAAALEAQRRSGVPAAVTLGQGAIESGWGRSARGNMLFGVKVRSTTPADHRQIGLTWEEGITQREIDRWRTLYERERTRNPGLAHPKYEIVEVLPDNDRNGTQRTRNGQPLYRVHVYLEFARYDSAVESIEDHNRTLHGRPYRAAWSHTDDPEQFAREVARGGYATGHDYEAQLVNAVQTINRLAAFDRDHADEAARLGGAHGDVNAEVGGDQHPADPTPQHPAPQHPAPQQPAPQQPAQTNGNRPAPTTGSPATQLFGIDYSSRPPSDDALAQSGVQFVCRYLSYSRSKNLTAREARHMSSLGISLVVVWETGARRPLSGRAAGVSDGRAALDQANALGMPAGRPIYFAVDFEATRHQLSNEIAEYFQGVNSVLGVERTGAYGGLATIRSLFDSGLIAYGWQTYAWSRGHWDPRAQLQQYRNDQHVGRASVDFDRAVAADFGQWTVAAAVPATTSSP